VDAVPRDVDPQEVRAYLTGLAGVQQLHDLHIWPMSTTDTALTAHLVMDPAPDSDGFLQEVSHQLEHRFGIHHPTIQIERAGSDAHCHQAAHCAE
jgi:cobalt-zinc-cadmium efflux system protein